MPLNKETKPNQTKPNVNVKARLEFEFIYYDDVIIIILQNGIDQPSLNLGQSCLRFTWEKTWIHIFLG